MFAELNQVHMSPVVLKPLVSFTTVGNIYSTCRIVHFNS